MNRANPHVTIMLLARRASALKRHVKAAAAGDERGIHQARVASRRLRETVPVLASGLADPKIRRARKQIRRVTRALGASRELDVTVALLDELANRAELPRLALEHVRAQVVKQRDARREVMSRGLAKVNLTKLVRRLDSLREALEKAASEPWRRVLTTRIVKRSRRLEQSVREAGQIYDAERLHRVRLAVKKLRYVLELAADTGAAGARPAVRLLKRTQDTLGRLHDLQVLQSHVAAVQSAPSPASVQARDLEDLSSALEAECRHLHARYVAMIPALLEINAGTRGSVVAQLSTRGSRAARNLNMTLPATRQRVQSSSIRQRIAGQRS